MSLLDWISTITDWTYVGLVVASIYYTRRSAPLAHVYIGLALVLAAVGAQIISLGTDLVDTERDGWIPVGLSFFTLVLGVGLSWFTANRIARTERAIR
jgi:hypothetical protein